MTIDWINFSPETALAGGALIGLAAFILMSIEGRIMGLSGILGGILRLTKEPQVWRIIFLFGTIVGAMGYQLLSPNGLSITMINEGGLLWLGVFLVGFGAALGSGCTSGHGICGLARLQVRSLAAVCCFIITAIITTWIMVSW